MVLTDDPANLAILEASTRLADDGLGFFVVGPGFLLRPGPGTAFAQFPRCGLHVDGLVMLPRGAFAPDCGAGRVLLVVGRKAPSKMVHGRLEMRPGSAQALFDASAALAV